MTESMGFGDAIKYPFNEFARLFIYYVMLIPIIGPFVLYGYFFNIYQQIINRDTGALPAFGDFGENLKKGFMLFLGVFLVLMINYGVYFLLLFTLGEIHESLNFFAALVLVVMMLPLPIQMAYYVDTGAFSSMFRYISGLRLVFGNFGDYLVTVLKMLGVYIVFMLASIPIITVIVTIPAIGFSGVALIADFYARHRG